MNIIENISQWWFKNLTVNVARNGLSFSYIVKYSAGANCTDDLPMLVALHGDMVDGFYEAVLGELEHRSFMNVAMSGLFTSLIFKVWKNRW